MKTPALFWFACITTWLCGLNAGFFYTWSFTITGSLDLIDPEHALAAMRSINANIRSGWFALIFFGSPLALLLCTIAAFASRGARQALPWLAALALMIATVVITSRLHVPMNNALAAAGNADAGALWRDYSSRWTQWNHLRSATSGLAFALAIIATARARTASLVGHD